LTQQLAGLADVFINDAFGSWQPHVSTFDITKYLPSYAGFLMQQEIMNLDSVVNPERPFLAVVAGSKYDTKIKPLYAIYDKVDKLILGGVIYNTFLCAKNGVTMAGVSASEIESAKDLVEKDKINKKIVELPYIVESDTMEGKIDGRFRTISIRDFVQGKQYGYVLDVDARSFEDRQPVEGKNYFCQRRYGICTSLHGRFRGIVQRYRSKQKRSQNVWRRRHSPRIQEPLPRTLSIGPG
jgi:phosphoglycerate kinase